MRELFGIQLGAEAEPGGICLSPTVYDVVKTHRNLEATYLGSPKLKSIQQAVPAYQTVPASQPSRGNAAVPEAEIGVGTLIDNRYRIQKVLGQGSFGRTYLASDKHRFDELCVLKEFVPASRAEYTVQKSRALFEREAKVLYQINHPQIPKFLACFAQMERLFLVQEYIDGKTYSQLLRERHQQGKLFSEAEVIQWLKDILPVLTYLHSRNIVHRNISPDNVMLPNGQSRPMLIDFGFGYAAPEQIRLGQCYPCSDLYALGVTVVVLLTGLEPNLLMDRRTLEWQWHDKVNISADLAKLLDKMIAEKPQDRYQSAEEVLADLHTLAFPGAIAVPTPPSDLHIELDTASLNRQVAEIEQMDYFQQLLRQAESLRNSVETDPLPQTT
jgi:serine/threonine-protein kinase